MKTPCLFNGGRAVVSYGSTLYMVVMGGGGVPVPVESHRQQITQGGAYSRLYIQLSAAPGAGNTITFTFRKKSADTALTVTISGTETSGFNITDEAAVAFGDEVNIKITYTGTPTVSVVEGGVLFEGKHKGGIVMGNVAGYPSNSLTQYMGIFGYGGSGFDAVGDYNLIAASGKLRKFRVECDRVPGSGRSYEYIIQKNGADTDLKVTLSTASAGEELSIAIDVSPGDVIGLKTVPTNTPTRPLNYVRWTIEWYPDTDGESIHSFGSSALPSNSAVRTQMITGTNKDWYSTTYLYSVIPYACTFRDLYAKVDTAPGADNSIIFTLRKNEADQVLAATIANTDTTGSDTDNDISCVAGDRVKLKTTPVSSPVTDASRFGVVCYIASADLTFTDPNAFRIELRDKNFELIKYLSNIPRRLMWEYNRIGGCGRCSMTLSADSQLFDNIAPDYDLRIYLGSATGLNLVYRGYAEIEQPTEARPHEIKLNFFGYFGQLRRVRVNETYTSQEVSVIIKAILDGYIVPNTSITYDEDDIQVTTFTVDTLEFDVLADSAIRTLAGLAGNYEWGVDRNLKFFFRERSNDIKHYVRHKIEVSTYDVINDYKDIKNRIIVKGGDVAGSPFEATVNNSESQAAYGLRTFILSNSAIVTSGVAQRYGTMLLADKARINSRATILIEASRTFFEEAIPLGKVAVISDTVR